MSLLNKKKSDGFILENNDDIVDLPTSNLSKKISLDSRGNLRLYGSTNSTENFEGINISMKSNNTTFSPSTTNTFEQVTGIDGIAEEKDESISDNQVTTAIRGSRSNGNNIDFYEEGNYLMVLNTDIDLAAGADDFQIAFARDTALDTQIGRTTSTKVTGFETWTSLSGVATPINFTSQTDTFGLYMSTSDSAAIINKDNVTDGNFGPGRVSTIKMNDFYAPERVETLALEGRLTLPAYEKNQFSYFYVPFEVSEGSSAYPNMIDYGFYESTEGTRNGAIVQSTPTLRNNTIPTYTYFYLDGIYDLNFSMILNWAIISTNKDVGINIIPLRSLDRSVTNLEDDPGIVFTVGNLPDGSIQINKLVSSGVTGDVTHNLSETNVDIPADYYAIFFYENSANIGFATTFDYGVTFTRTGDSTVQIIRGHVTHNGYNYSSKSYIILPTENRLSIPVYPDITYPAFNEFNDGSRDDVPFTLQHIRGDYRLSNSSYYYFDGTYNVTFTIDFETSDTASNSLWLFISRVGTYDRNLENLEDTTIHTAFVESADLRFMFQSFSGTTGIVSRTISSTGKSLTAGYWYFYVHDGGNTSRYPSNLPYTITMTRTGAA